MAGAKVRGDLTRELRDSVGVLRRGRWLLLSVVAVVMASALFQSFRRTPIYESTAEVVVRHVNLSPTAAPLALLVDVQTERSLASSDEVALSALSRLAESGTPPAGVGVETALNGQTLTFRSLSASPVSAQASAQAYAEAYLEFRRQQALADLEAASEPLEQRVAELAAEVTKLEQALATEERQAERRALRTRMYSLDAQRTLLEQKLGSFVDPGEIRVGRIINPAPLPRTPISPDHGKTATMALTIGFCFGVGVVFVRERRHERSWSREVLVQLVDGPVLGEIPPFRGADGRAGVETAERPLSPASEAFKVLRGNLLYALAQRRAKTVLVTSAVFDEGKTTTAVNLAAAVAATGRLVVLVSADVRTRGFDRFFPGRAPFPGLAAPVRIPGEGSITLEASDVPGVLLLFMADVHSARLVDPATFGRTLAQLRGFADVVVVDAPPVLRVVDSVAFAQSADAVLLVVNPKRSSPGAVQEAVSELRQVGAHLVGAVLNERRPDDDVGVRRGIGRSVGPASAAATRATRASSMASRAETARPLTVARPRSGPHDGT